MSMDVSVRDIGDFKEKIEEIKSSFSGATGAIKEAASVLQNTAKNIISTCSKCLKSISEDKAKCANAISSNSQKIQSWQSEISNLNSKISSEKSTSMIDLYEAQIKKLQTSIDDAMNKNTSLSKISGELDKSAAFYADIMNKVPDVGGAVGSANSDASRAASDLESLIESYASLSENGMKIVNQVGTSLCRAGGSSFSDSTKVRVSSSSSLSSAASALRNAKNRIESCGDTLIRSSSSFSSSVNDEISRSALESCRNACSEIESLVGDLNDIAGCLEDAERGVREYENLK